MASGQVFIGVDVGGTKVAVNGIDENRQPISPQWLEMPSNSHIGPSATVSQIVAAVQAFMQRQNIAAASIAGAGVDSPGPANINGRIERSSNMNSNWEGFELRENVQTQLSAALAKPIHVSYENDCNSAGLWESFVGDPQGREVMALLAPGTGLGGGIVIKGRLLRGTRGMGAELGHLEIVHPPFMDGWQPQCGCGRIHCAEAYASMAALARILRFALVQEKYRNHPLNQVKGADEAETWKKRAYAVRGLAAAGDELCLAIFDWQSAALARLCHQVACVIDPDRLVIGGGFIEGGAALTERIMGVIRAEFAKITFKAYAAGVKFEVARSGDQAGCLGAALSAWQHAHHQG